MSIGCRSQSARTYLEKHLNEFQNSGEEELVIHGLSSLQETLSSEEKATEKNVSIAVVSMDGFKILNEENVSYYINKIAKPETAVVETS